jgi:hypothetical protein
VGNVCFLEGMVFFKGKWLLYYGTADSKIAVAEAPLYDYRGMVDQRAKARKEAAAIESERSSHEEAEEVFHRFKAQALHRVKTPESQPSAEEGDLASESSELDAKVEVEDSEASPPRPSASLDAVAEEL